MNNLKFLLTFILLISISCDSDVDFGNTNVDRDVPTNANTQSLMAGAMNYYFTLSGRNYHTKPMLYVQYESQNTYTDEQRYNEAPVGWTGYYQYTLSNLKDIITINSADEVDDLTRTYGATVNQIGVSKLMSALIWKRITDSWGDVPYTEALNPEILTPAYTPQEDIYRGLIADVKAARDMLDPSLAGPTGDVIYGGDVSKWQKFANSFLLSATLQLSKKYPAADGFAATEFKAALAHSAGVIEDVDDEMWYHYSADAGTFNPFAQLRPSDYSLSIGFTDALKGQADGSTITYTNSTYDSRLDLFANNSALDGQTYGVGESPSGTFAAVSAAISSVDSPLPYMTASYTYLNRAEAASMGWTTEPVQTMFVTGVEKSFETLDAHYIGDGSLASAGSTFAAARWLDALTNSEAQVIAEEKWVSLFPLGFDAWSEWRRTGYPVLIPSPEPFNDGTIPRRFPYPGDEPGVNTSNYHAGVSTLSPASDNNSSRFWWDN